MLNYETLLSSYDDKLTLMQWLKKVEKALAGASASSFEVIKTGNATIRFRINFEDGTYLESGDMVLQQGESVSSGEIRNGHLYLTLTNGLELDCGTLFNGEIPNMQVRSLEVTGGLIVGDDANAAIGGDLVVHGLTEVQNLLAYGHVETGTLTAAGEQITAEKPVVEDMTGYTATIQSAAFAADYIGVCKNGNKITFAAAGTITTGETLDDDYVLMKINVPQSIGVKLVPHWNAVLDIKDINLLTDEYAMPIKSYCRVMRWSTTDIRFILLKGSMAANSTYYLRVEATFLLSENLAA